MEKMTKKEIKEVAQEEIMNMVASVLITYQEQSDGHGKYTKQVEAEIMKQADRVARLFGYNEAWHN